MRAGLNKLRPRLQCVEKCRARCRQVESPRALCSQFVLHQTRGGREEHVGGDRRHHNSFDLARIDTPLLQRDLGCLRRQVTCSYAFIDDMPFPDPSPAGDPFIRRLNNLFEVGIGHHPGRNIGSEGRDLGTPRLVHSIRFSVVECETLLYARPTESPIAPGLDEHLT